MTKCNVILQKRNVEALASPDDCELAEDIAKADTQVQAMLRERNITRLDLVACDPWSGKLHIPCVHVPSEYAFYLSAFQVDCNKNIHHGEDQYKTIMTQSLSQGLASYGDSCCVSAILGGRCVTSFKVRDADCSVINMSSICSE